MRPRTYATYILTNTTHTVLYVGVTGDLIARIARHRAGEGSRFCRRYRLWKLVHYEPCTEPRGAIAREKQLKGGSRAAKVRWIEESNPGWEDLAETRLGLGRFVPGRSQGDCFGGSAASQ